MKVFTIDLNLCRDRPVGLTPDEKIDLIILDETWRDASTHCNYEISRYNLLFST